MSNRSKVVRTLLLLGIVACIAGAGVFSAFSSQTENPGNIITAGTVTIEDSDGGTALYSIANAKPEETKTSCIKVTYKGSLPSTVKLYSPTAAGCTEFTPASSGATVYEGTLSAFVTEHGTYANGVTTNPASATKWETNNSVVYRFIATLSGSAPEAMQGKSTNGPAFRWEAQNQ